MRGSLLFAIALGCTAAATTTAVAMAGAETPGRSTAVAPPAGGQDAPDIIASMLRPPQWTSDGDMHQLFLERFRAAVGLGQARMFSSSLQVSPGMQLTLRATNDEDRAAGPVDLQYALNKLELIGIARHPQPVAFVIDRHTDRSRSEQTRALTSFEQRALAVLRSGETTTAQTTNTGRLVAGAIRATNECLGCHAAFKEGELLGAFSYQLTRLRK